MAYEPTAECLTAAHTKIVNVLYDQWLSVGDIRWQDVSLVVGEDPQGSIFKTLFLTAARSTTERLGEFLENRVSGLELKFNGPPLSINTINAVKDLVAELDKCGAATPGGGGGSGTTPLPSEGLPSWVWLTGIGALAWLLWRR